jgi:hypothetical protein
MSVAAKMAGARRLMKGTWNASMKGPDASMKGPDALMKGPDALMKGTRTL